MNTAAGPDTRLRIGILHYSCPPVVGGVEEIVRQHASIFHRMGHSVSVLAGMGEVFTDCFPITIEPILGSRNVHIAKVHKQCREGDETELKESAERVYKILADWACNLDVVLAHNVLHMPFNLPLTLAVRCLAGTGNKPAIVSWAHDSPYFQPAPPKYLDNPPWSVLRRSHNNIYYVTISDSRKALFDEYLGDFSWKVLRNGIDPLEFFYFAPKSIQLSEELNLFNRDMVVVQPSRITPRKNLELSIHIIRGIKLLGYNVLFVLTGAYDPHEQRAVSYYRRLRYWINELGLQENIAVLAEYTFRDGERLVPGRALIRDLYLTSDLLLMTSKDEGFGLPLLEAGMIKLPIACSEIAAFKELGEDVCFFRLDEPPLTIAGRIIQYLAQTNTHKMYRKVMHRYVWDVICKEEVLPFLCGITQQSALGGKKVMEDR